MKKVYYIIASFVLVASSFSCTDESTFNNPATNDLENGAFVRFLNDGVAPTYSDAANISISEEIYDANGNISDYTIALRANVSGTIFIAEDFINITSFPAVLNITSESMATAIGLEPTDFGFGDAFTFIATATRNDGVVFYGIEPSFDDDNLTVGVGNTEGNLFSEAAYKNAMNFGTIVSCPFEQAAMLGTYTVINDSGFNAIDNGGSPSLGNGDPETFEVIAGTNANQIILVNPFDSAGDFNIAVDVSEFGIASFSRQDAVLTEEVCCAGYTPTHLRSNTGATSLALSCIGFLDLRVVSGLGVAGGDGTGFTFGGFTVLSAQKN